MTREYIIHCGLCVLEHFTVNEDDIISLNLSYITNPVPSTEGTPGFETLRRHIPENQLCTFFSVFFYSLMNCHISLCFKRKVSETSILLRFNDIFLFFVFLKGLFVCCLVGCGAGNQTKGLCIPGKPCH